uniref:Uncharacterized protein n=1 Tax=Anguilla anguilla TaxID=7936 RepID=A0A0E9REL0_ANGAN
MHARLLMILLDISMCHGAFKLTLF